MFGTWRIGFGPGGEDRENSSSYPLPPERGTRITCPVADVLSVAEVGYMSVTKEYE